MLARARFSPTLALLLASAALAACSGGGEVNTATGGTTQNVPDPPYDGPTYYKDIVPIVQKSCQSCHRAGEIAPFGLTSYEEVSTVAGLIAIETKSRRMPPWGALETGECKPKHAWQDDLRLSDAEIATFEAWSQAGAPKGA